MPAASGIGAAVVILTALGTTAPQGTWTVVQDGGEAGPGGVLGYFMTTATHFFLLAGLVGLVQGGTQALSRSLFASMIPRHKSSEFFAFFSVFERYAGAARRVPDTMRGAIPVIARCSWTTLGVGRQGSYDGQDRGGPRVRPACFSDLSYGGHR